MFFRGVYDYLSNFYNSPIEVEIEGKTYTFQCVEAAFQAHKCPERAEEFVSMYGAQAKKHGRKVPLRSDWNDIKLDVMKKCCEIKFQNTALANHLYYETDFIAEDNTWHDTYWGRCNGIGENHLGKILMKIKNEHFQKMFGLTMDPKLFNVLYIYQHDADIYRCTLENIYHGDLAKFINEEAPKLDYPDIL